MARARSVAFQALPKPAASEWLCLVLGLLLVVQYAWLLDDSYVFFKYVDNLLYLGIGLVHNEGEYTEGFSSPLWTLLLIGLRSTGLGYWLIVRLVGVASFVFVWAVLLRVNRGFSRPDDPIVNLPLILVSLTYGPLCYFTSGTESPLVLVMGAAYALFVLRPDSRVLVGLLAFSPLVRHELAVPFALALAWKWSRERRTPWAMALWGVTVTGSWLAFRIYYYADLFPNTFYLKNDTDFAQGLVYLDDTLGPYGWYVLLAAAGALLGLLARRRPRLELHGAERLALLVLAAPVLAYVLKVGGDARHFRYLAFPVVLAACSLSGLPERALRAWAPERGRALALPLALLLMVGAASAYPRQLSRHPLRGDSARSMVSKISDAAGHRYNPNTPEAPPWGSGAELELAGRYPALRERADAFAHTGVRIGENCWANYRDFELRSIHRYGLTDPFLARSTVPTTRPGHKRGLYGLASDIVALEQWWGRQPGRGMFRAAVEAGVAPAWVRENLAVIEVIEEKTFNRHDPVENLKLAFAFPGRIATQGRPPPSRRRGRRDPAARADAPTNVLLVSLDTTRADRLGGYGSEAGLTPNLDALARSGTLFELAISTSGATPIAHASLLTGLNPYRHGVRVITAPSGHRLPDAIPTLATTLASAGWRTAAFLSSFTVSSYFGFERGFELFDDGLDGDAEQMLRKGRSGTWSWNMRRNQRRSDATTERFLAWLDAVDEPFFAWIHYWDPHDIQLLPPPAALGGLEPPAKDPPLRDAAIYDAEVRFVDRQIGRVLEALRERGLEDRTLVVVVADHGEGLGDHGWGRHRRLYQEQIRVPLILRFPGRQAGGRVAELVRIIDVFPTVLEELGIDPEQPVQGRSLLPLLEGRGDAPRPAYAEQLNEWDENAGKAHRSPRDLLIYSVVDGGWKLIHRPRAPGQDELYHLARDPGETANLYDPKHPEAIRLKALLDSHAAYRWEPFGGARVDPQVLERLRSLGYVEDP